MLALALQSKLRVYLIVEDKIIDYIEYNHSLRQMIVEVARIVTKLDIGSFVLTDPVISLRALLSQYHMYDSMCTCDVLYVCVRLCMCVYMYVCVHVCVCTCMCVTLYTRACVYVYVGVLCVCVCVNCVISVLGLTLEKLYSYIIIIMIV